MKITQKPLEISNSNSTNEDPKKLAENKLREVADMYEQHFIREMIKQMRSTVKESGFIKTNNAEKIFRDQLDDKYAEDWTKSGGIGLSQMIYDQLVDKYGTRMGLKFPEQKPQGPLPINSKSNFSGITRVDSQPGAPTSTQNPTSFNFLTDQEKPTEILNPWAGVLLDKKVTGLDQMQYRIKHDNGLESLIQSRGTGLGPGKNLSPGDELPAGVQLGWASPASPLIWTVKENVSE